MKTAQQQHDDMLANTPLKLASQEEFKKVLEQCSYDPIQNAMQRHPGLTKEKAEEMARALGFL
jgi:hypothetical protein